MVSVEIFRRKSDISYRNTEASLAAPKQLRVFPHLRCFSSLKWPRFCTRHFRNDLRSFRIGCTTTFLEFHIRVRTFVKYPRRRDENIITFEFYILRLNVNIIRNRQQISTHVYATEFFFFLLQDHSHICRHFQNVNILVGRCVCTLV